MIQRNKAIIDGAIVVARETDADAILLAASLPEETAYLHNAVGAERRVIAAAATGEAPFVVRDGELLILPEIRMRRRGRAKVALLEGLASGFLQPGQRVVVISGSTVNEESKLDTVAIMELGSEESGAHEDAPLSLLREAADPAVFDAILRLCVELGHDGKEGKSVGLLVTLGDYDEVLSRSQQLVLNPFAGHPEHERCILFPSARRAIREFSGMDGAFVLRSDGVVVAGGRYLLELAAESAVPSGLGARHRAAAGISTTTRCIAFAVSESSGDTRIFGGGRLLMTIEGGD
jgi:diadenylate cyclase